jgi:hypothetical protein
VNDKDKKVYKIANQKDPNLEVHAGHKVELTGELKATRSRSPRSRCPPKSSRSCDTDMAPILC